MIGAVAAKEFLELRRDGRVVATAGLIALLVIGGLLTGVSTLVDRQKQVEAAQRDDRETFLSQGAKPPHSAAHFGRMAYKPVPAFAAFDPGALPYLGQVIWLEAHRQDPAMFRPAEDSPELRRLADLSIAGVLGLLLPLLIFVMGHGAFAAERERGTLRQLLIAGHRLPNLFSGKFATIAGIGVGVSTAVIALTLVLVLFIPGDVSAPDIFIRGGLLIVGYGAYGMVFAAVALCVSARSGSATSALLVLLGLWALTVVIVPRVAASVAQHVYPTPASHAFWSATDKAMRANTPSRKSEAYREIEREVLSRAAGREITASEAASMSLNRRGVNLEISEILGAKTYADAYRTLYDTYQQQHRLRRLFAIASPTIGLQHFSSAVAGTDIAAHRHFALEAERQRNLIIRKMNEDMMLNGREKGDAYLSSADFWQTIPDFRYSAPTTGNAAASAGWDLVILIVWSVGAFVLASWVACKQRVD